MGNNYKMYCEVFTHHLQSCHSIWKDLIFPKAPSLTISAYITCRQNNKTNDCYAVLSLLPLPASSPCSQLPGPQILSP